MPTICTITPTISRPTLKRALTSARLEKGDEWIVVGDGPQPEAEAVCRGLRILPYLRYVEGPESHDWGNTQRDLGMSLSDKDYFVFVDDDDVFNSGAIQAIRYQLSDGPLMFRIWHNGGVIWTSRDMSVGNVARSMFVIPNRPGKLARWADDPSYESDFSFIQRTMALWRPTDLVWAGEIIQVCRPETSDEWRHLA